MVADEAADLGLSGRDRVTLKRDEDLAVVVSQVAVGSDRSQIHPFADVRVAQEALVILVGETMNDRVLDLAADPAIRADRYRAPDVRPKELGLGADVAWALHPGEWLDPDVGSDHDGAVRRVENGVGVDTRCLVHTQQVGRPHQGKGRQLTVGYPVLPSLEEIALDVSAISGHQVPRPADPLSAHIDPRMRGGDPVEPGIDGTRVEFHGVLWSDQGARRLTTAKAEPGTVGIRRLEAPGRDPAPVGHDHGPSCEPVAIVDHYMGIALVLDGNQMRANHACSLPRPLPDPKCRRNLGAPVGAAKPEFIDRACQRERLKSSHSEIFDQAKTHHPSPLFPRATGFQTVSWEFSRLRTLK